MAQTNPKIINGGVEQVEGSKKERLWTVPVASLAIAAIIISLILFRDTIGGWFGSGDPDEPFDRWSTDTVEEKLENDETFVLFLYGEGCPFCKDFMFGDGNETSGYGPLQEWNDDYYDHDFGAYWTTNEMEEEDDAGFSGIEDYLEELEDKIAANGEIDSEQFKWRDRIYDWGSNSNTSKPSTTLRPGIPSMFFFVDGYLQTVQEGNKDISDLLILQGRVELAPIGPGTT